MPYFSARKPRAYLNFARLFGGPTCGMTCPPGGLILCVKKVNDKKIQNCQFTCPDNKVNISFDKDLDNDYLRSLLQLPILSLSLLSVSCPGGGIRCLVPIYSIAQNCTETTPET